VTAAAEATANKPSTGFPCWSLARFPFPLLAGKAPRESPAGSGRSPEGGRRKDATANEEES